MELTPELIRLFAPTPIYDSSREFSKWVLSSITPTLLVIAMWVRIAETQLDSFSNAPQWAAALKDFLWWGFVLGSYFLLGGIVAELLNSFYGMFDQKGSLSLIYRQVEDLIAHMNASEKASGGVLGAALNLLTAPFAFLAFALYYLSLMFVTFIILFMRVALALGFGVVFIWGLIAIPMAMTTNYSLLKGWAILAGGIAAWPVMESIFIGLFSPVLQNVSSGLFSGAGPTFFVEKTGVYFFYTLLNIMIAVIVIAAPIIAGLLVANYQSLTGMVAPFVAGAAGATAGLIKISKEKSALAGRTALSSATQGLEKGLETLRSRSGSSASKGLFRAGEGMGPARQRAASSSVNLASLDAKFGRSTQPGNRAKTKAGQERSEKSQSSTTNPPVTKASYKKPGRRRGSVEARRGYFIHQSSKRRPS